MKLKYSMSSIIVLFVLVSSSSAFEAPNDILGIRPFSSRFCANVTEGNLEDPTQSIVKADVSYITRGLNNTFADDNWFFVVVSAGNGTTLTRVALQVQLNDEAGTIVGHFSTKIPCNKDKDLLTSNDMKEVNHVSIFDPNSEVSEEMSPRVVVILFKKPVSTFVLGMMIPALTVKTLKATSLIETMTQQTHHLGFFVTVTAIDSNDICYYNQVSPLNLMPDNSPISLPMILFPWAQCIMSSDKKVTPKRLENGQHTVRYEGQADTNSASKIKAYKTLLEEYQKKRDKELEKEYAKPFVDDVPKSFTSFLQLYNDQSKANDAKDEDIVALRPQNIMTDKCTRTEFGVISDPSKTIVQISAYFSPYEYWYNVKIQLPSKQRVKIAVLQAYDAETGDVIGRFTKEFPCKPLSDQGSVSKKSPDLLEQVQDVFGKTVFTAYSVGDPTPDDPTIAYVELNSPGAESFIITIKFDDLTPLFFIAATVITTDNLCYQNQVSRVYQGSALPLGIKGADIRKPVFPLECDKFEEVEVSIEQGEEIEPTLIQSNPKIKELHGKTLADLKDMGSVVMTELLKKHVEEFNIRNKLNILTTTTTTKPKEVNVLKSSDPISRPLSDPSAMSDPTLTVASNVKLTSVEPTSVECIGGYGPYCRDNSVTKRKRRKKGQVVTTVEMTTPTTTTPTTTTPTTTTPTTTTPTTTTPTTTTPTTTTPTTTTPTTTTPTTTTPTTTTPTTTTPTTITPTTTTPTTTTEDPFIEDESGPEIIGTSTIFEDYDDPTTPETTTPAQIITSKQTRRTTIKTTTTEKATRKTRPSTTPSTSTTEEPTTPEVIKPKLPAFCAKPGFWDSQCGKSSQKPTKIIDQVMGMRISKMPFQQDIWLHIDIFNKATVPAEEQIHIKGVAIAVANLQGKVIGQFAEFIPCIQNHEPKHKGHRNYSELFELLDKDITTGKRMLEVYECPMDPVLNLNYPPTSSFLHFKEPVLAFYFHYRFAVAEYKSMEFSDPGTSGFQVMVIILDDDGICYTHLLSRKSGLKPRIPVTEPTKVPINCHAGEGVQPYGGGSTDNFILPGTDPDYDTWMAFSSEHPTSRKPANVPKIKGAIDKIVSEHNEVFNGKIVTTEAPNEVIIASGKPFEVIDEIESGGGDSGGSVNNINQPGHVPRGNERSKQLSKKQQMYIECEHTKGCLGEPADCIPGKSCLSIVSYVKEGDNVRFEIYSTAQKYAAIGLSRDLEMGDDSVIECVREDDNLIKAYVSWNVAAPAKQNIRSSKKVQEFISDVSGTFEDGDIYCTFLHKKDFTHNAHAFDLEHEKFYILHVGGSVASDGLEGNLKIHDRFVTSKTPEIVYRHVGKSPLQLLIDKIHGCVMIVVWTFLIPCTAFVTRYFKETFLKVFILNFSLWYGVHIIGMTLAILLTFSTVIAIYTVGLRMPGQNEWTFHSIVGILMLLIMILQIPLAVGILKYNRIYKYLFINFIHGFDGHLLFVLGFVMMYKSRTMRDGLPCESRGTLITFIVTYMVLHLCMSYQVCYSDFVQGRRVSRSYTLGNLDVPERSLDGKEEPGALSRKFLLVVFVVLGVIFMAALMMQFTLGELDCIVLSQR